MKIVIVSRVLNEDDIIESFVRHHAAAAAQFVFLDDGSTDRTLDILRALKNEGIPIRVVQMQSSTADQAPRSTWLYHHADQEFKPDWVIFLDVDEFIDTSLAKMTIKTYLSQVPAEVDYIRWKLVNYATTPGDDPLQPIVPRRMRWRTKLPSTVDKVAIRGGLSSHGLVINSGQHSASCRDKELTKREETNILLAHYPERSVWQKIAKNTIGWLKVTAAGQTVVKSGRSYHYKDMFEKILYMPDTVVFNPRIITPELDKTHYVHQPLAWGGGNLKYYLPQDNRMKTIQAVLQYAEHLAKQHGRLMEEVPGAKEATESWYQKREILF